jgi:hypothetical protein
LEEYLTHFDKYCGKKIDPTNLYCERDSNILTSAQACVLPLDKNKVEFAVDLYNYQSSTSEPAVLVIMATTYGTSAQVTCGGNTVLYFNANNTAHLFKAERLTEYRISQGRPVDGPMTAEEKAMNGIYIFQVPLKITPKYQSFKSTNFYESAAPTCAYNQNFSFKYKTTSGMAFSMPESLAMDEESEELEAGDDLFGDSDSAPAKTAMKSRGMGMERAILKVGEAKGVFQGITKSSGSNYELMRDTNRPVRLTVQFYMCTDINDISQANVDEIAKQIRHIYDQGLNESSLVVDHEVPKPGLPSTTPKPRPTATTTKSSYVESHLNNSIL